MEESLFGEVEAANQRSHEPLASRMRPQSLADYVGQQHILGDGALLRRMMQSGTLGSLILAGPPGTGKTTLARLIAKETGCTMQTLSATSSGVKDVREVLRWASDEIAAGGKRPILFIDEIHRFSRSQQDALLPDVESGTISLVGATTANPHFAINAALLSRSQVFYLESLSAADIASLLHRALSHPHGLGEAPERISDKAIEFLATACEGDARRALTTLEIACGSTPVGQTVSKQTVCASLGSRLAGYDATGDDHYDLASALIKTIRGSDVDGAIYWLARMLEGGEDIRFLCRRLVILASEDIGNADPQALQIAVAAMQACEFVGLPECQLTLSQTVAYLALAPKSNAATRAIGAARTDVRNQRTIPVPKALKDAHNAGGKSRGHGEGYRSAHHSEDGFVAADFLGLASPYYFPVDRGNEAELKIRLEAIRRQLGVEVPDE
ncbi:MAG: replication-associated recombination protein A [Planctomycetota bacterium]